MRIKLKKSNLKNLVFCILISLFYSSICFAHGAHEHGVAHIDIAYTANKVQINLNIPSIDIYGFEHEAKADQDKIKIKKELILMNKNILNIFSFNKKLDCRLNEAKIDPFLKEDNSESNEKNLLTAEHGNFMASYIFLCKEPLLKSTLNISFKNLFPSIHKLIIQIIGDKTQKGYTIKAPSGSVKM